MAPNNKTSSYDTNSRATASEKLAVAALLLYVSANILFLRSTFLETYPEFSIVNPLALCNAISMSFAAISIALKPRPLSRNQFLLAAATMAAFLVSASNCGGLDLVHSCVLLIAIAGNDLRHIAKMYYRTTLIAIVVAIALSISNEIYNRDIITNYRLVFSYGMPHPNTLGAFLFSGLAAMTYACWTERTWHVPFALSIAGATFSILCLSSNSTMVTISLLAVSNLLGHTLLSKASLNISRRVFIVLLITIPGILLTIMIICTTSYDASNQMFSAFNNLTHGRPQFSHSYYVAHEGFTLLGRPFVYDGSYHNGLPFGNVDSGYCFVPLVYGLLALFSIIAIYIAAVLHLSRKHTRFATMSILLIAALYLVVETYAMLPATSFAALFLSEAFATTCIQGINR